MQSKLRSMTKALRAINEAGEQGQPVVLPATPRGARNIDALNHPGWSWTAFRDDYVRGYHSHDDDDDDDRECVNCGDSRYYCECGDYEPEPSESSGREYVHWPRGWRQLSGDTPVGHALVGVELEVVPRVWDDDRESGPAARFLGITTGVAETETGLSFILEEDSSLPNDGFEIISGYGLWPAVARGWCHVLDSVDTHRVICGVDPALRPNEWSHEELEQELVKQRATVWNWPGGEGLVPLDDLTSDTYGQVYVAAPSWMGQYAKAASEYPDPGTGAPNRGEQRVRDTKHRGDKCGMHVHVSFRPSVHGKPDMSPYALARGCKKIMVDFLKTDTLGYLFVVGRLPDSSFCSVGCEDRYSLVACRRSTTEFRGFASTLNPRMFAARVELALAIHYVVSMKDEEYHTWEHVWSYVLSGEAGLENLRTTLLMLPAFKVSCEQQMSLPFVDPFDGQAENEEGCVTDPAVPGISKESNMNVNITLNNPTVHVHMGAAGSTPVVNIDPSTPTSDLVDAMNTAAAEASAASTGGTVTSATPDTPDTPDEVARAAYGVEGTNAAKAQWSIGKYVDDGERELRDEYDDEETVGKVVGVLFRNGDSIGVHPVGATYRSLYREAGGYAKLGSREFNYASDVFNLSDSTGRDFIGAAVVVEA